MSVEPLSQWGWQEPGVFLQNQHNWSGGTRMSHVSCMHMSLDLLHAHVPGLNVDVAEMAIVRLLLTV
jgi:hypothetical protein